MDINLKTITFQYFLHSIATLSPKNIFYKNNVFGFNILQSMAISKNSELLLVLFGRGTYKHSYCIYCTNCFFI